MPVSESRPEYLTRVAKLLLYLAKRSPDKEALATMALTTWLRLFNDQLTRLLRLADNHRPYVDAQFEVFASRLESADPTVFDPVALIKKHVDKLAVTLTESRSKQLLKSMFPAPVKPKGSTAQGPGTNSGGADDGGDAEQIPGPGPQAPSGTGLTIVTCAMSMKPTVVALRTFA